MKKVLGLIALFCGSGVLHSMDKMSFSQAIVQTSTELLSIYKDHLLPKYNPIHIVNNTNAPFDDKGNTLLHILVVWYSAYHKSCDFDSISILLNCSSLIKHNIENIYGVSALDLAIAAGEEIIITMMLKEATGVPFHLKTRLQIIKTREFLLKEEARGYLNLETQSPNSPCYRGNNTQLHMLVVKYNKNHEAKHLAMIEDLLKDDRTLDDIENNRGVTAFALAQDAQDTEIMGLMLDRKKRVPSHFFIALVRAANHFCVKTLLKRPPCVDINEQVFGRTALHYAVIRLDYDMVSALFTHPQLDPNIKDRQGNTVLHILVSWSNACHQPAGSCEQMLYHELIDLLLQDTRTRCDVLDKNGRTVLNFVWDSSIESKLMRHHKKLQADCNKKYSTTHFVE